MFTDVTPRGRVAGRAHRPDAGGRVLHITADSDALTSPHSRQCEASRDLSRADSLSANVDDLPRNGAPRRVRQMIRSGSRAKSRQGVSFESRVAASPHVSENKRSSKRN